MTGMPDYRSRAKLLDVREERRGRRFEFREDKDSNQVILEGYAATFEPYDVHGGPDAGGWVEKLDLRCFDNTLAEQPDLQLLINHEGTPLARTKSGTLQLSRDRHGLRVRASLDPSDPDVQRLIPKMRRGDMDEMSFAFRVTDQTWDTSYTNRTINHLSLEKGDVSVVNYGMNPGTRAILSADAVGTLAQLSDKELVELRKVDRNKLARAQAILSAAVEQRDTKPQSYKPPAGVKAEGKRALEWIKAGHAGANFTDVGRKRAEDLARGASLSLDTIKRMSSYLARHAVDKKGKGWSPGEDGYPSPGRVAWAAWGGDPAVSWTHSILNAKDDERGDSKPASGDVAYADPGYKPDGKKRYPIDTVEHCRAAWSYINMPKNQVGYTSSQVNSIKTRIKAALKKFGVDVSEAKTDGRAMDSAITSTTKSPLQPVQWAPDTTQDPHTMNFDMKDGDYTMMPDQLGEIPGNIAGGALATQPDFTPGPFGDPHDIAKEMLAMDSEMAQCTDDPHETPYDVAEVKRDEEEMGMDMAERAYTEADVMKLLAGLDAVIDEAGCLTGDMDRKDLPEDLGQALDLLAAAQGLIDKMMWMTGTYDPDDPSRSLRDAKADPDGDGDNEEEETKDMEEDDCEEKGFDWSLAEALDRTIVHAYKLAGDNMDVRKALAFARSQLKQMRGIDAAGTSEISKKLTELRKEVGMPDTGSVSDGLKYLRSMGAAPVGYRGLLNDPTAKQDDQMWPGKAGMSPAELLEKERRARVAQKELEEAQERNRQALREAELQDAISRMRG